MSYCYSKICNEDNAINISCISQCCENLLTAIKECVEKHWAVIEYCGCLHPNKEQTTSALKYLEAQKKEDEPQLTTKDTNTITPEIDITEQENITQPFILEGGRQTSNITIIGDNNWELLEVNASKKEEVSPFKGVLLTVDEISSNIPNKGPGCPVYVPTKTAIAASKIINESKGLGLDAHPDLKSHNKGGVVGVMNASQLVGNEFIVEGNLFDYNQPEMVGKIRARKNELGMSINADIEGFYVQMQGQKVFYVDKLTPKGANILEAEQATWSKTKVLAAQKKPQKLPSDSIDDNSTTDTSESHNNDMNDEQLKALLGGFTADISKSVQESQSQLTQRMEDNNNAVLGQITALNNRVQTLEASRQQEIQQQNALVAQEREREEQLLRDQQMAQRVVQTLLNTPIGNEVVGQQNQQLQAQNSNISYGQNSNPNYGGVANYRSTISPGMSLTQSGNMAMQASANHSISNEKERLQMQLNAAKQKADEIDSYPLGDPRRTSEERVALGSLISNLKFKLNGLTAF